MNIIYLIFHFDIQFVSEQIPENYNDKFGSYFIDNLENLTFLSVNNIIWHT